jgi:hypothetical protein
MSKTAMDTWLRIQGLKEPKKRKPIMYFTACFGNLELESNTSIALLKHKYKDQPGVTFKTIR